MNLIWNCIWYYIFDRNLIFGEKKIQSTLHICISMDSIEGRKIFGKKKFREIPKNTTWICHSSSTVYIALILYLGFPGGSDSTESACSAGDMVWSMDREDPLEKEMATYSSILAWRIPWTEEPGGLQSMGSQRVRHDWATNITLLIHYIYNYLHGVYIAFSSVAQSYLILCEPHRLHSMPGFPVHHQLLELAKTHVHWVGDAIQPSHSLSSPSPP